MSDSESQKDLKVESEINVPTEEADDKHATNVTNHDDNAASEPNDTDNQSEITNESFKDAENDEGEPEEEAEDETHSALESTPVAESEELVAESIQIEKTETLHDDDKTPEESILERTETAKEAEEKEEEIPEVIIAKSETPVESVAEHQTDEASEGEPSEELLRNTPTEDNTKEATEVPSMETETEEPVIANDTTPQEDVTDVSIPVLPPRENTAIPVLPPREHTAIPVLPPRENTAAVPVIADYKNRKSITEEEAVYINTTDVPTASTLNERELNSMGVPAKGVKNWFKFKIGADSKENDNEEVLNKLAHPSNYDLALYRFEGNEESLKYISEKSREQVHIAHDSLRNTFNVIKSGIEYTNNDELIKGIDWEFWTEIATDYSKVVKEKPDELLVHITNGIPNELRGMIWQLITNSKSFELEETFRESKDKDSTYAKAIRRDLVRTSFVRDSAVVSKIEDLYDVIKAYSLYDPEVGYTQGMAFITVPLLMNMAAHESFSMLVGLMKNYGFRELYLPDMPGLHLKLYQFDRLLEDLCPDLHIHLARQGVRSSMYVTQWFLTLFGYKFPLELVLRIYDVVIAEGIDCILKFAINLMLQSKDHILKLNFDSLLPFLKEKIFFQYLIRFKESEKKDSEVSSPNNEVLSGEITLETYDLEAFVTDAMSIRILPLTLNRYSAEYDEIHRIENERKQEIEELRTQNGHLMQEIRNIEASYALMNREHVDIVNEMVKGKVSVADLEEENKRLNEEIVTLNARIESLEIEVEQNKDKDKSGEQINIDSTNFEGVNLELEIQNTMNRNLEVMEENRLLEEQLANLEDQYNATKTELENLKISHKDLRNKWGSLKKNFW